MDERKMLKVKSLLYDCSNAEIQAFISRTTDQEVLYVYAYNYNWDNGFEVPRLILDNDNCELSTALLVFYRADGVRYLLDKSCNKNLLRWHSFVEKLYVSILDGIYQKGDIGFKVPLTKIQKFQFIKKLSDQENIFFKDIEGMNLDIDV